MTDAVHPDVPPADELSAPFWEATRERRYLLQWCTACERAIHYPRFVCPSCGGDALEWRPSTGAGTVHARTVVHVAAVPWMAGRLPYVVALVDLDEGVRVMGNVVDLDGVDPASVAIGDRVELTWEALPDGRHLPQFRLAQLSQ